MNPKPENMARGCALAAGCLLVAAAWPAAAQSDDAARQARALSLARPAASPGYRAADAAYKAYDRHEYAVAVEQAREAVRLVPANRAWRLLLVNSLLAAGQLAEADAALEDAVRTVGDDGSLARAREPLRRAQAQAAGGRMYKALEANDVQGAVQHARAAVEYAPENPGYRLVLVHTLLRAGEFEAADKTAGETIALLPDSAVALALRSHARQRLGRGAEARADLERALAQPGLDERSQRELRLIAADSALAAGDTARAAALLHPLAADAEVQARRVAASRPVTPRGTPALALPAIDCADVESAQTCRMVAAAAPPDPAYQFAAAAYQAVEAKDTPAAYENARQAAAAAPAQRDYQLLLMNTALAEGRLSEAEQAATAALALEPRDAAVLSQRSNIRRRLGNGPGAEQDAQAALALGSLPPVDHAYLSLQSGNNEGARAAFARADGAGELPATSLQDAAYTAMRAGRDAEAIDYFRRTIDAAESLQLKLTPQMLFDTRRAVAEVSRKWGVLASVTYRDSPGTFANVGGQSGAVGNATAQAGVEVYWRPWGFRNGRFVELFARGFETLHSEAGGSTGSDSFQGALGVRWKPLSAHNAVLSLSRVFNADGDSDWLAQAAYSLDVGTDLRVDVPSWWTTRIAAEIGRFTENPQTYGLASVQAGRSFAVGSTGRTVVFPHAVVAGEYNSTFAERTSVGVGPGVGVRHWFREDKYHAPRSYVDFTLQYRVPVGGDDRIKGLYLNSLLSY